MKHIVYIAEDAKKARQALEQMNIGSAKELLDRVITQLTSHPLIYVSVNDEQWAKDTKQMMDNAGKSK